jgi:two-component system, sensor histidine kinase and response regulator
MSKEIILVVDDEPNNLEVIETLLSGENYEIYYANSGEEALSGLAAFSPDAILLDLTMPGMDGLEFCRRLKMMRQWKSVPIIMMTGATSKNILSQCLDAGADDFIRKPVEKLELRARIRSMIRIKKQFDRIESFTKLQQKNIDLLVDNLDEMGGDLATGLANELNIPLNIVVNNLNTVAHDIYNLDRADVLELVSSANLAAIQLVQLTNKIWTYIELALAKKTVGTQEISNLKTIFERVSIVQFQFSQRKYPIDIDIENAAIAVTNQHCELIVKELLTYGIELAESQQSVAIRGRAIDGIFRLWMTTPAASDIDLPPTVATLSIPRQKLGLGLKIIKTIVDLYDGLFSITAVDETAPSKLSYYSTIYLTLPLN